MPKHKHADLIIAWANGVQIQLNHNGKWIDCDPDWYDSCEYRIKPDRVWPVTSLNLTELHAIWEESEGSLFTIANAAIKRHEEDKEK